jgi:hypothetical protein
MFAERLASGEGLVTEAEQECCHPVSILGLSRAEGAVTEPTGSPAVERHAISSKNGVDGAKSVNARAGVVG